MSLLERIGVERGTSRKATAAARAVASLMELASCNLCAHRCGVNRVAGAKGLCRAGAEARVFSAQLEVSDELEISPAFAISLSGCDMRCSFCITGAESWNPNVGEPVGPPALGLEAEEALAAGAKTVMILGGEPTIHLPAALRIAAAMPEHATLVWKTNGHGSAEARRWLDGIFDLWLVDDKFGSDACAKDLSGIDGYVAAVRENILWARQHSDLIVRHLLMPGHVECCWRPVAEWIVEHCPEVKIGLRDGYWPAWRGVRRPPLNRVIHADEWSRALEIAANLGLNLIP